MNISSRTTAVVGSLVLLTSIAPTSQAATADRAVAASDSFARSVSSGWGSADAGGAWTTSASGASVSSGLGQLAVARGASGIAQLSSVDSEDTDVTVDLAASKAASGGGFYVSLVGRGTAANGYRATARLMAGGALVLSLRRTAASAETILSSVQVPGITVAEGTKVRVRMQVSGTTPTTLRAKAWLPASAEPDAWAVSATDSTSALQAAGPLGVVAYVSTSATPASVAFSFDNVDATTALPPNVLPKAAFEVSAKDLAVSVDAGASSDSDGSLSSFVWDFGDGSTGTGATASHVYAAGGTYSVRLTVTDDRDGSASVTRSVTAVVPNLMPTVAPGASVTGVPDSVTLRVLDADNKPYAGDSFNADGTVFTIRTPGAVYDRWRFDAFVEVRAPGVVITNSHLRGAATTVDRGLLLVSPDPTTAGQPSATISDSTVSPRIPSVYIDGIRGSNFTARRVEITGTVDGVHIHGTAARTDPNAGNVTVEASWIHDLTFYANDPRQTDGSHNDNVQMVGGRNVTLRYNTLTGARNAAFMIKPDRNTITDVTLEGNWAGNGACTTNIDNGSQTTMTGINVVNNHINRDSTYKCGIIISKPVTATLTDNTWSDTNTATSIVWR